MSAGPSAGAARAQHAAAPQTNRRASYRRAAVIAAAAVVGFSVYAVVSAPPLHPDSSAPNAASPQASANASSQCANSHSANGKIVCDDDELPSAQASASPTPAPSPPVNVDLRALPGWPNEQPKTVSLTELYDRYEANEVSADNSYRGHLLQVEGKVDEIKKDIMDKTYLGLNVQGHVFGINATLNPIYVPLAANISKGQNVLVVCVGAEKIITPQLSNCAIGTVDGRPVEQPSRT
jgi:hypothetical protein